MLAPLAETTGDEFKDEADKVVLHGFNMSVFKATLANGENCYLMEL